MTIFLPTEGAGSLRGKLYPFTVSDQFPSRGPAFLVMTSNWTLSQPEYKTFTKLQVPLEGVGTANVLGDASGAVPYATVSNSFHSYKNSSDAGSCAPPSTADVLFSICYTSWESNNAHVEMGTQTQLNEEPHIKLQTDLSSSSSVDLSSILAHYSLNSSLARATLNLSNPIYNSSLAYATQQPGTGQNIAYLPIFFFLGSVSRKPDSHSIQPPDSYVGPSLEDIGVPNPILQKFFLDSMNISNNSLASSLSALLTLVSSTSYYEQLPLFTKTGTAEIVTFETVSYPQSWRGFATVACLLGAHLVTCTVILCTFLTRTRYTRLGSSWASVAQIFGAGTEVLLRDSTLASDAEVEKLLAEKQRAQELVRISLVENESGQRYEPVFVQGEVE
ncbi:hypothetical protein M426DRAFT_257240 [Hypoxylon sp. CI-4A]|nr:hypothetical protein M426DRAFT_257240 [Hypoxylon sp. CI-4A]